jgi:hypothetical protein
MALDSRWDNAVHFNRHSFKTFWEERLRNKGDVLLITGQGWDPRMTILPKLLREIGGSGLRIVHLIHYSPTPDFESPYQTFINKNLEEFEKATAGWADVEKIKIYTRKEGNFYVGDDEIARVYSRYDLSRFTDIVVDISALPKSLFFTLLLVLVKRSDSAYSGVNIHVVACQNVELDNQIMESADDTRILKGFNGKMRKLSLQDLPVIWAPVLAENKSVSLRKLYDQIGPKDIYPILPFPSKNPRSDDDLLVEYRQIFESEWRLNPMNILYAAEDDPCDVYRSLYGLFQQQEDALKLLGGISMVVSALSSKISSIGAFMAAFETKNMAVMHPIGRHDPPQNMTLEYWNDDKMTTFKENLHSIWLTGEPYV